MVVVIKKNDSPEKVQKQLKKIFNETALNREKRFAKYVGVIELREDPVIMQRRWRDEG